MTRELSVRACGDRAAVVRLAEGLDPSVNARVHALSRALVASRHPAFVEVVPGYTSLLLEYEPMRTTWAELTALIRSALASLPPADELVGRTVSIPVLYGGKAGPDLPSVAACAGLTRSEVVRRHAGSGYRVYCLGFTPGFAYMGSIDPAIATPRLESPRLSVPAGSVGIAGPQTGIYPSESPGGWQLIGRTPLSLFDPERNPPSLLMPGDRVEFTPITPAAFRRLARKPEPSPRQTSLLPGAPGLRMLQTGLLDTVQDLGRWGYQALGVSVSGAADPRALMIGNWLVGNRSGAAGIEITLTGPRVEFTGASVCALAGAFAAELIPAGGGSPHPVPPWTAILVGPGDQLRIGPATSGCRGYLCVSGGIKVPRVLGSRSTDLLGKIGPFGGRCLRAGDWLPVGWSLLPPADLAGRTLPPGTELEFPTDVALRAVPGPQDSAFTPAGLEALFGGTYRVTTRSDRQGIRLQGPPVAHRSAADIISEGMPLGGIQVPAGGMPILMLAGRQTMGGYAKAGVVISADAARAAQLPPGAQICFRRISVAEAHAAAREERRSLAEIERILATHRIPQPPSVQDCPTPTCQQPRLFLVRIAGKEFAATVVEETS